MIDKYILSYFQHGIDQAYAYTKYAITQYDPNSTHLEQFNKYIQYLLTLGDSRVTTWPIMNYRVMLIITFAYLWAISALVLIMKYVPPMSQWEQGKGFNVKPLAFIHNLVLTTLSLYMCVTIAYEAIINNYSMFGNGVDQSDKGYSMARILYIFYLSKILEFIDTVLMALRKSFRQITFLHLYHHASIFVIWWVIIYYAPGGDSYFSAMLNSFIHVILYGYYLWSSLASKLPEGKKPTFTHPQYYRQYITRMQLIQFMFMLAQAIYVISVPSSYPRFAAWILFYYMLTMLTLFGNFYLQQYIFGRKKRKVSSGTKKTQ